MFKGLSAHRNTIILIIASSLILFIGIKMYQWLNTETTDNAYLEADITFVSPEVSGIIHKIMVADHQKVQKGDILAKIDDANYRHQLIIAKSKQTGATKEVEIAAQEVKVAKLKLHQATEQLDFALTNHTLTQQEYKRIRSLKQQSFSSQDVLDKIKISLAKTEFELKNAKLQKQIAEDSLVLLTAKYEASLEKVNATAEQVQIAQLALDNTILSAPINGIIGNTQLRIGSFARTGVPLLAIVPEDSFHIKANFKETQIKHFTIGSKVMIALDTQPSHSLIGKIRSIAPATGAKFSLIPPDNATGNFTKVIQRIPVIIDLEIPDDMTPYAKAGVSAKVSASM